MLPSSLPLATSVAVVTALRRLPTSERANSHASTSPAAMPTSREMTVSVAEEV